MRQRSFLGIVTNVFNATQTLFSLIVVYFIYLFAKEKGWSFLTFLSKWYLVIIVGILGFFIFFISVFTLASFFMWIPFFMHRRR